MTPPRSRRSWRAVFFAGGLALALSLGEGCHTPAANAPTPSEPSGQRAPALAPAPSEAPPLHTAPSTTPGAERISRQAHRSDCEALKERDAFEGADVTACERYGQMMRFGLGGRVDAEGARALFETLCERAEDGLSCARLGQMIERSEGLSQGEAREDESSRSARSKALYIKSAELGEAEGMWLLGERALWEEQGDRDEARAWFERACALKHARGCEQEGMMHQFGLGTERDFERAAARYELGCRYGSATSCAALGHLYETELIQGRSASDAAELYTSGCEEQGEAVACLNLGFLHEVGRGVARSEERALALYERACRHGEEGGCHRLSELNRETNSP